MIGITEDRLQTLLGSAKANLAETQKTIWHYEGAIQTLTLLLDDLRAQAIKHNAEPEQVEGTPANDGESVDLSDSQPPEE